MGKLLYSDPQAEKEANDIAFRFMDSQDVMGDMERAYHTDFSSVSIHTDESAAEKTAEAGVDAFASGKDIFFGRDAFNQSDPASRGLLAHELVHTMQQDSGEAMQSAAPAGAEQGGILDWFRGLFGKKKKNEDIEISAPHDLQLNQSDDAKTYRQAMEPVFAADRARLINRTATPEARIGQGGGAGTGEAFANALQGKYIDSSNQALKGENGRNAALVNLGIRNSADAPSQAEKAMRGDIYEGLGQNYADWMYSLQESGLDMGGILQNGTSTTDMVKMKDGHIDKFAYATGGGYDALSDKAMDMFSEYVLSDQSVDYVRKFSEGVAPADVFGGQKYGLAGASGYALHTLSNTVGANVSQARSDDRLSTDSQRVAVQMGRMMGSLPVLAQLPDESVPKSLIPLRDRYRQLQAELDKRLQETG